MSIKMILTLLATSILTVGCVAYPDHPSYRGNYGTYNQNHRPYDHDQRYRELQRERLIAQQRIEQQRRAKVLREQAKKRQEIAKKHRELEQKRHELERRRHQNQSHQPQNHHRH